MEGAGRRESSWRTAANGVSFVRLLLTAPLSRLWSRTGSLAVGLFLLAAAATASTGISPARGGDQPLGNSSIRSPTRCWASPS